jgi:hypothetical protein
LKIENREFNGKKWEGRGWEINIKTANNNKLIAIINVCL